MNDSADKHAVDVEIGGDTYTVRTEADPEYARRCARYLDDALAKSMRGGNIVESQKAVVLAALSLVDELFTARAETDALRDEIGRLSRNLTADVEAAVPAQDLASPS